MAQELTRRLSTLGFWLAALAIIGAFVLMLLGTLTVPVGCLFMALGGAILLS